MIFLMEPSFVQWMLLVLISHVPHNESLEIMREIIEEFEKELDCAVSAQDFVVLTELILENNFLNLTKIIP